MNAKVCIALVSALALTVGTTACGSGPGAGGSAVWDSPEREAAPPSGTAGEGRGQPEPDSGYDAPTADASNDSSSVARDSGSAAWDSSTIDSGPGEAGHPAACGNGALEVGEQCDDGNVADGDLCDHTCTVEALCGNGSTDVGEECDDGNTTLGDGCSPICTVES